MWTSYYRTWTTNSSATSCSCGHVNLNIHICSLYTRVGKQFNEYSYHTVDRVPTTVSKPFSLLGYIIHQFFYSIFFNNIV